MIDNNLKYAREELELTQKELGYTLGVSEFTISGWETGKDYIPLRHLIKIGNLYNLSIDYILGFERKNIIYSKISKINNIEIGKKLKNYRINNNYTQQEIADDLEISQSNYSNYEMGKRTISSIALYTLRKKHKFSIDELLGRKKEA